MEKAIQLAYDELFEKRCKFAHMAGFTKIAVNFVPVLDKTEDEWSEITENIMEILLRYKLSCIQSHPYYYDLLLSSEEKEERLEFAIKQSVKASGKLGARWCVLHPRSSISTGFSGKQALIENREDFLGYLEVAHKYGTGIAAENLPIFPGLWPTRPFYSSDFYDLYELAESLGDKGTGICWDTGHANLMAFDQAEAIKYLGKKIKCTHIHNNHKREDDHNAPDNGNIEWERVIGALSQYGDNVPLTLETHPKETDDKTLKEFFDHNYKCLLEIEKFSK